MTKNAIEKIQQGDTLIYSDGRDGHCGVKCQVIEKDTTGMVVMFEDRADVTRINFKETAWMAHLSR